jgi:hypothetical protein
VESIVKIIETPGVDVIESEATIQRGKNSVRKATVQYKDNTCEVTYADRDTTKTLTPMDQILYITGLQFPSGHQEEARSRVSSPN